MTCNQVLEANTETFFGCGGIMSKDVYSQMKCLTSTYVAVHYAFCGWNTEIEPIYWNFIKHREVLLRVVGNCSSKISDLSLVILTTRGNKYDVPFVRVIRLSV